MSRTAQRSDLQQSPKAGPDFGVTTFAITTIPLQMAMVLAESQKRLQIEQIEATLEAVSENSRYCSSVIEQMMNGSGLLAQWSELCNRKARRYNDFAYACIDIMSQSASAMSRLGSPSVTRDSGSFQGANSRSSAPVRERRVSAKIISFPDRRIASGSVLM